MTYLATEPQLLAAAAADVDGIGSALSAANAAAAGPTSGLLAPAADEISATVAELFGTYGQEYRALVEQATVFNNEFSRLLATAGGAYAAVETAASNALGTLGADAQSLVGGAPAAPGGTPFVDPPNPLTPPTVALVMGGSGNPIPNTTFVNGVLKWATLTGYSWNTAQAIFTPENLYPLTGSKSLPLNISVNEGVQILDASIKQSLAGGNSVLVQGYSQSSIISSLEMRNLMNPALNPNPPSSTQLAFNLLGDPMNPNGGLLARFPGLSLPSIGLEFYGATPPDAPWHTAIYSLEYDGFADFPRYPIDVLSDLNAVAGILYVHPNYPHLDPATLPPGDIVTLPVESTYTGNTTYYMVHTQNLPLLEPFRSIPVIGNPLADLLQPDMRALVNVGYGDPNYGYSTSPANVPTPFGLIPPVSPGVLGADLVTGAQQGITAATGDLVAEGLSFPPSVSLSGMTNPLTSLTLSSPGALLSPPSIGGYAQTLQHAITNIPNAVSSAVSDAFSIVQPTVDIANAAIISIPAYDASLFAQGIGQALGGDPVGLIRAVGDPLAASAGLFSVAGGVEGLVVILTTVNVLKDIASI
ncbi:PE family protein [Mycobacterium sp. Marseille-P9652]|uniref:PE family protein n=1 Tax=Mycobacterium sp. Marseille-P9652 TaxID=2654950 RepID=UPI0012E94058|nr:PE-PPE domain-containing protein [Mycobacterium sp. Marseille-P9652]